MKARSYALAGALFLSAAAQAHAQEEVPPELQLSADELSALGIDADTPVLDTSLKLSGFADVGFGSAIGPKDSPNRSSGSVPSRSTFYVGNFNVYLGKQLSESISMLSEVRLTFLPNGSSEFGLADAVDTTASDYTDFGRVTRWGGIILQRIYIEYSPHPLVNIRVGQFLTPYGVWNVDHGSPVFIPVRRPWSIGVGWIPERQTGVEIYGRTVFAGYHALGYHLTLSNGTGSISEYADLDENKAVGGRVFWEYRGFGRLRLGASAYYGRHTDSQVRTVLRDGRSRAQDTIKAQYDSLTWAGDLTWNLGGLHIQSEWITNQRAYTDRGRAQVSYTGITPFLPQDMFSWGGYGLIGYRFEWGGIMPFFVSERVSGELIHMRVKLYTVQAGLNIRPTDALVLKASYERVKFASGLFDPLQVIMTQIAWAF